MNARLLELATRHGALKARVDAQRQRLARHAEPLERALLKGDQALDGVNWLKKHPAVVGAGFALLVAARPKRAWRWASRGLFLWRALQSVKKSLEKMG